MDEKLDSRPVLAVGWLVGWLILSSIWMLTAARQQGATADEAPYLERGLDRWRTGSYKVFMGMGTMPLPADVHTLPLYLRERWRGTPYEPLRDMDRMLFWARAASLVFWGVFLTYGWLAARSLAGPLGGWIAVPLMACEPNLIAHGGLATTDLPIAACLLALVYHFRIGRDKGWVFRLALPAFWMGVSLLAKASAVLFGPVCLIVVGLEHLLRTTLPQKTTRRQLAFRLLRDGLVVGTVGMALAILYCGSEWQPAAGLAVWVEQQPPGFRRDAIAWLASWHVYPNAAEGILWQVCQNQSGTPAYLLGKVHPTGCWFYFQAVLSMKLSEAVLLLPFVVIILRPRALANWACLAALALLALSVTYRVQNGVRMVLPLVGLGVVGLAAALAETLREATPLWERRVLGATLATALGWMMLSAALLWPDAIRHVNHFWGGTETGYLCSNNADYDWGQGLRLLDRWHRKKGRPPMLVWTFGNDPFVLKMQARQMQLGDLPLKSETELPSHVRGHFVAVSLLNLYGYFDTPACRYLKSCRPVARTSTYFIYDFTRMP